MTSKFGFQVTIRDRTIWLFPEDVNSAIATAKAQAEALKNAAKDARDKALNAVKTGISYSWTRESGKDPISLGAFADLTGFVDDMVKKAGIDFKAQDQIDGRSLAQLKIGRLLGPDYRFALQQ